MVRYNIYVEFCGAGEATPNIYQVVIWVRFSQHKSEVSSGVLANKSLPSEHAAVRGIILSQKKRKDQNTGQVWQNKTKDKRGERQTLLHPCSSLPHQNSLLAYFLS